MKLTHRTIFALAFALFTAGSVCAQPVEVEGVKLEPTTQIGSTNLQLNGAGIRVKVFFKVYVGGLYVPQKSTDAAALLAQKGARRFTIVMLRNVDADTFASALVDGLHANHSEAQLATMKPQIDGLIANLKMAGEAKKGDVIHLDFVPEAGTRVMVNGQARGAAIPGEDFYTSVLRIWLGDKPADSGLKKGLLGG
jgi:hypothetical protein